MEYTLGSSFQISGVGLHSGIFTQVVVMPAAAGDGRYFVRVDLPELPRIAAQVENVINTTLSTELAQGAARIRTVEHLLAALAASGVDNARIEINGSEVPLLDGSALTWVEAIANVGVIPCSSQEEKIAQPLSITSPVWIHQDDAFVVALPCNDTRFTYGIDFQYTAIGNQWCSFSLAKESFYDEIAPARTFALANQIEQLQQAGLIKGGSLENALVCSDTGWLNPPLRFSNEPARHKLLDLIGDLSLLGRFPVAHFLAYKASHKLHINLVQKIVQKSFI